MEMILSTIKWLVFIAACLYLAATTALYIMQRHLLYYPPHPAHYEAKHNFEFRVDDKTVLRGWVINAEKPDAIIFYGGNAERIDQYIQPYRNLFPDHAIYLVNYRGYGESDGHPTEKSLFADALAIFDQVKTKHKRIDLVGKSLGSGVAVYVAAHRNIHKLVLITPYDSILNVARVHYPIFPIGILLKDKFESWKYAGRIKAPTLILSAENDRTIPAASTNNLAAHIKPALLTMEQIKGVDHNSISDNQACFEEMKQFLAAR